VMSLREEELAVFSEAVDIYHKLAETNPAGFAPDFGFVMLTGLLRDYWSSGYAVSRSPLNFGDGPR